MRTNINMKKQLSLSTLRNEYSLMELNEQEIHKNPIKQFHEWMEQALTAKIHEPTAMTLATVSPKGKPSARIVLLKEFSPAGFVFFTNYKSKKGTEILENPNVALLFHWIELERQVRIEGKVKKISREESLLYFHSRPRGSQLGALVSQQSSIIHGRKELENTLSELEEKYKGKPIPLPPYWGGYCVKPLYIEFWQGRKNRLHDRIAYTKKNNNWKIQRLSP